MGTLKNKKNVEKINNDAKSALHLFILEKSVPSNEKKSEKVIENIQKLYQSLSREEKIAIAQFTAELIKKKYFQNESFYNHIHSFCIVSGSDDDWKMRLVFSDFLFEEMEHFVFFKTVIDCFFKIVDLESEFENQNQIIFASSLALLVEIGVQSAKNKYNLSLGAEDSIHIVDFISSNFLARSNVNNKSIRIALVYYLTHIDDKHKSYLHKVLSRFGQTLLDDIFTQYFSSKDKDDVAFHFLSEHLDEFLAGNAFIAEMTHSVLKNHMLKNPDKFPLFLNRYFDLIKKDAKRDHNKIKNITVHTTFLLKTACEIGKEKMTEELTEVLIKYFDVHRMIGQDFFMDQYKFVVDVLSTSKAALAFKILHSILATYDEKSIQKGTLNPMNAQIIYFKPEKQKQSSKNEKTIALSEIFLLNHLLRLAS